MKTDLKSCTLGEACGCARIAQAFRWLTPCPNPVAPSRKRHTLALWLPLSLCLGLGYALHGRYGDPGALLGVILGLSLGFIMLRCFKF